MYVENYYEMNSTENQWLQKEIAVRGKDRKFRYLKIRMTDAKTEDVVPRVWPVRVVPLLVEGDTMTQFYTNPAIIKGRQELEEYERVLVQYTEETLNNGNTEKARKSFCVMGAYTREGRVLEERKVSGYAEVV